MIYERRPRWMKTLAVMGLLIYTICAGIGAGWLITHLFG